MDESLRLLQYLYDELSAEEEAALEERLAQDAALREEYEALRSTKKDLDGRPAASQPSPDPGAVDRVVDAAADAASASRADRPARRDAASRADRAAQPGVPGLTRRLQMVSAALALLLVVGVGWWQWNDPSFDAVLPTSASSNIRSAEGGTERVQNQRESPRQTASSRNASLPEWDEGDEVIQLHRRIEMIQSRSTPSEWSGSLQPASQTVRP